MSEARAGLLGPLCQNAECKIVMGLEGPACQVPTALGLAGEPATAPPAPLRNAPHGGKTRDSLQPHRLAGAPPAMAAVKLPPSLPAPLRRRSPAVSPISSLSAQFFSTLHGSRRLATSTMPAPPPPVFAHKTAQPSLGSDDRELVRDTSNHTR